MPIIVHAADIHLDSPLRGLSVDESSPDIEEIRGATRKALEDLVSFVMSEKIPLLLIAGDLYDGDWKDFGTGLYFVQQMNRLATKGIKVAIVRGNHDAANTMTRSLPLPENVHVFSEKAPETLILDELGIAIHGQSYPTRDVTDNIALSYPPPIQDMFNIGLLHCLISGATGHQSYAPCSLEQLVAKDYDYWALGHVHQFKQLHSDPPVIYSGCTQGRHIREPGAKGCVRVNTDLEPPQVDFVSVDVLRWISIEVDISNLQTFDEILSAFKDNFQQIIDELEDRICCARVILKGGTPLHGQLQLEREALLANLKATAGQISNSKALIEKIELKTNPEIDFISLAQSDTPQGELLRYLEELTSSEEVFEDLEIDLTSLKSKLIGSGVSADFNDQLLLDVRDILLTLLSDFENKGETK